MMPLRIAQASGGRGAAAGRGAARPRRPERPAHARAGDALGRRAAARGHGARAGDGGRRSCSPTSPPATSTSTPPRRCTGSCARCTASRADLGHRHAQHAARRAVRPRPPPRGRRPPLATAPRCTRLPATRLPVRPRLRHLRAIALRNTVDPIGWMELPRWFDGRVAYNGQQVTSAPAHGQRGSECASLAGMHADVRTLHRTGAAGPLLRALRSQPARERLDRDGAPPARPDP